MSEAAAEKTGAGEAGWWSGRSGLVLAVLMLALALYLSVGVITMEVPAGAEAPGPAFFPTIIAVACYVLAALLVLHYVRTPEQPKDSEGSEQIAGQQQHATFTDWRALGITVGAFLAFTVLLNPLGWIIAAAVMFWVIAWAMGSRTPLRDIAISLVVACTVQVTFSLGLGLNLPSGILEGVL